MAAESAQASVFDQTLALKVTGRWLGVSGHTGVARTEETLSDRTLGESGRAGPDAFGHENSRLEPYYDRTLRSSVRSLSN